MEPIQQLAQLDRFLSDLHLTREQHSTIQMFMQAIRSNLNSSAKGNDGRP